MVYHDGRHLFCLVVEAHHSHFTKRSGVFLFWQAGYSTDLKPALQLVLHWFSRCESWVTYLFLKRLICRLIVYENIAHDKTNTITGKIKMSTVKIIINWTVSRPNITYSPLSYFNLLIIVIIQIWFYSIASQNDAFNLDDSFYIQHSSNVESA